MSKSIYVISDSVGETAEVVVKAALSQFLDDGSYTFHRIPYVKDFDVLKETVRKAANETAVIGFTLVDPVLRQLLLKEAKQANVECIDIIGPLMEAMEREFKKKPRLKPGLVHQLDEEYFRRVEAIEFAVRYDDGRDPKGIRKADIILIGVSRTSKTPLSQYLAHKQFKVANVPVVPEVEPPKELFDVDPAKCIGLSISTDQLNGIRKERLRSLGLGSQSSYANLNRIEQEINYFNDIVNEIGCPIIDVSGQAVEETANKIITILGDKQ